MPPTICPICGQSKLVRVEDQYEMLSGGVLMAFEVYACQSNKDQCAAVRDNGSYGTHILVPTVQFVAASASGGGTEAVLVEAPPVAVTVVPAAAVTGP